jgi:hypothetical protein
MVQLFKKAGADANRLFKKVGETGNRLFKKGGTVEKGLQNIGSVAGSVGKRLRTAADLVDIAAPLNPEAQMLSAGLRSGDAAAQKLKKVSKIATEGGNVLERASKIKEETNNINYV